MISVGDYIIVTSNYQGDDELSIDTAVCYYREGRIDTLAFLSKNEIDEGYVKDYTEGMEVDGGVQIYNIIVKEFSEVLANVLKLCQLFYDFEDHTKLLVWNTIDSDIIDEIESLSVAGEAMDTRMQFTKFKDIIKGTFDMETLYINHDVNDTLYEDETDVLAINLAQSELLISLNSRD